MRPVKVPLGGPGLGRIAALASLAAILLLPQLALSQANVMQQAAGVEEGARNAVEKELFHSFVCLCLDCQRQNIGECRCGYAAEKRQWVRTQLQAGKTPDQIREMWKQMKDPKGEAYGLRGFTVPPNQGFFRLSYMIGYAALLLAAGLIVVIGRRWRARQLAGDETAAETGSAAAPGPAAGEADESYRQRLRAELDELD